MIQSNGEILQVLVIGSGFTQPKNSTYMVRSDDKLLEVLKDGTATLTYPGYPDVIAEVIGGKTYGILPGVTSIHCNQKFNIGR